MLHTYGAGNVADGPSRWKDPNCNPPPKTSVPLVERHGAFGEWRTPRPQARRDRFGATGESSSPSLPSRRRESRRPSVRYEPFVPSRALALCGVRDHLRQFEISEPRARSPFAIRATDRLRALYGRAVDIAPHKHPQPPDTRGDLSLRAGHRWDCSPEVVRKDEPSRR